MGEIAGCAGDLVAALEKLSLPFKGRARVGMGGQSSVKWTHPHPGCPLAAALALPLCREANPLGGHGEISVFDS